MPSALRRPEVLVVAAIAAAAGAFLALNGWPQPERVFEFAALMLSSALVSALTAQRSAARDWAIMPPSFIVNFAAILILGPHAASAVATTGAITQGLADADDSHRLRRGVINLVTVIAAVQAAGWTHQLTGGTLFNFTWPDQGLPIALAILAYCIVKSASAEIIVPFATRQPIDRSWPNSIVRGGPGYCIGAGVAVGCVSIIAQQRWEIVPVVAVPLYFAFRAFAAQIAHLDEESRRREAMASFDQGMSAIDTNGVITLWNEGSERLLDCPRGRALGRTLQAAVPALGKTELPRAITDAVATGTPRSLAQLTLPASAGGRTLQVRLLPGAGGVTLIWDDVTERARAETALKRSEERLTLAAEGATDGLWEWDLRTQELYCSTRWRAMLGMSAPAGTGPVAEWIDRVHEDDRVALKEALGAHLAGTTAHFQHRHRIRHEDGTYRQFVCRGVAVLGAGRRPVRIAGSLTDAAERASGPAGADSAGFLDPLTGLGNRAVFVEGLGRRLEDLKRRRSTQLFAALYLDLDRFKVVNDSLGHLVGDELLIAVSRRLESCLRPGDAIARLGGDEFAILLNELSDVNQANAIAFRIQAALSAPFAIGGREVFTSASIGIACGQDQYNNPDEIMRDADTAMYHAKSRGKARHELFDADMHARELDRIGLESDLRHAVNTNDFEVHYQPIVLLKTGMCVGFESLARWTRNGKPVSPATFVPLAEELGIIEPMGTWMLQQACSTFADWKRRYPDSNLDYITVNVSSRQLMQQNFLWMVERAVEKAGLEPRDLRLEITETALMDSPNEAAKLLRDLRAFGAKIYLDDFGCGYSSLSHLAKLPVDALKIDRSFVNSLLLPDRPAIVESILALARTLKTGVVAEGIEQEAQGRELQRLGCTHAQGYYFSRPLAPAAAEALIAANQPLGPKRVEPADPPHDLNGSGSAYSGAARPIEWPEEVLARTS